MLEHAQAAERRDMPPDPAPSLFPARSSEAINSLAHYHRAEIGRMAGWRDRIDRTTNWAITVVAAMLSVSLSAPSAHHGVLLFAMLIVLLLLTTEARRYRFFDVYRARVRLIERNHFARLFDPAAPYDPDWPRLLAADLRAPRFLLTRRAAMSRRLRRNYGWMFVILLLAWMLKISSTKLQQEGVDFEFAHSLGEVAGNAALGVIPGAFVIAAVAAFYAWLLYAILHNPRAMGELAHGEVHM